MHRRLGQPCQDLLGTREIQLGQVGENDEADVEEWHDLAPFVLKRERNSVGEAANVRANARSMRRSDPNPHVTAMIST
jgi:hypothetical protein